MNGKVRKSLLASLHHFQVPADNLFHFGAAMGFQSKRIDQRAVRSEGLGNFMSVPSSPSIRNFLKSGFNASLIAGEEPDLCWRIRAKGGLILHIDAPMTGHDLAIVNWRQYCRRAIRTGHAYAEIADLYGRTADPLWSHASRHNAIRGGVYLFAPIAAVSAAILDRSWVPLLLLVLGALGLILRTALRARRRRTSASTLILFAIHSHVQQVPIFLGQVRQWLNSRQCQKSALIEYKNG